jgi:hypothetical protein
MFITLSHKKQLHAYIGFGIRRSSLVMLSAIIGCNHPTWTQNHWFQNEETVDGPRARPLLFLSDSVNVPITHNGLGERCFFGHCLRNHFSELLLAALLLVASASFARRAPKTVKIQPASALPGCRLLPSLFSGNFLSRVITTVLIFSTCLRQPR